MSLMKMVLGVTTVLAVLTGVPARGQAQSCTSDVDCAKGTTCQRGQSVAPSRGSIEPDCGDAGGCESIPPDQSSCQAGPCQADSDCGTGMICHSEQTQTCSGGGGSCPANTDCGTIATTAETCTTTTTKTCAYAWQLPCTADADCGAGFTCAPTVTGSCSGGGGTTPSPGATDPEAKPAAIPVGAADDAGDASNADAGQVCTSTSTFPGTCQAKARSCTSAADCPANWTCAPSSDTPTGGTVTVTGTGGSASSPAPAETSVAVVQTCQAPNAFPVRGGGSAEAAVDVNKGGDGGQATGAPVTGAPQADGGVGLSKDATSSGGSGCSMAGSAPSLNGPAAGIFMLLAFAIRSRRGLRQVGVAPRRTRV